MMIVRLCGRNHARKFGLGDIGDITSTGEGRTKGFGDFLQGGGAGYSIVWVGDMGSFGVNGEEGRGNTHGVPATDHREAIEVIRGQDMGEAMGGRRSRGSRKPVGEDLHIETAGNRVAVVVATSLILGVCKGYKVQRKGAKEGGVVTPRGNRERTSGHPGRLAGS